MHAGDKKTHWPFKSTVRFKRADAPLNGILAAQKDAVAARGSLRIFTYRRLDYKQRGLLGRSSR